MKSVLMDWTLRRGHPDGLAERTLQEGFLSSFKPQEVANTVFAKLGIQNKALMSGPAQRTPRKGFPSSFKP